MAKGKLRGIGAQRAREILNVLEAARVPMDAESILALLMVTGLLAGITVEQVGKAAGRPRPESVADMQALLDDYFSVMTAAAVKTEGFQHLQPQVDAWLREKIEKFNAEGGEAAAALMAQVETQIAAQDCDLFQEGEAGDGQEDEG